MNDLLEQNCNELKTELISLSTDEVSPLLKQLDPEWEFDNQNSTISHTFSLKNYYQTMAFVNVIAQIAHQQDHHPDLHVSYNRCTVTYSTHSVGGLSIKDFICAAKINAAQNL
jgi:4a-hydroxytetrahydrobiopterin dehydratase